MTDWMSGLSQLAGVSSALIWAVFLVFMRVGAMMALLPAFGEQSVPQRVRLVLTLAFTAVVGPAVLPDVPAFDDRLLGPVIGEVVAGLVIGMGLRFFIHALQIAGAIAAQSTSLSQLTAGVGPEPQPAIGQVLMIAGLTLATATGLHVRAAELMILSYDVFPAGRLPEAADLAEWGLAQISAAFGLGLSLAAPFVAASVIYNLALGVINRAMPQLMVSLIGAPALTLGGLALLAISAPLALSVWLAALNRFLANPFAVP